MIDRYTFLDCNGWYTSIDRYVSGARGAAVNRLAEYENTGLEPKETVKLKAERDAAIADMFGYCSRCKYFRGASGAEKCATCVNTVGNDQNWEWRGPQQEET